MAYKLRDYPDLQSIFFLFMALIGINQIVMIKKGGL